MTAPLLQTLSGEKLWPPPVWLMRQAGRYLPEFRQIRQKADFLTRCLTPELATELTLQPIKRFGMDGAILFSDILILPWALGRELSFPENIGPKMPPLKDVHELKKCKAHLESGEAFAKMAPVREALTLLRRELNPKTALLGFAGSPFTVSCYMVEGGGSKNFLQTRKMMIGAPAFYQELIDILIQGTIEMLKGQIEAGAQAVMLFDSWAGILPADEFRQWVIAPTQKIVKALKQAHPAVKIIGFPRLSGMMAPLYAKETGVDVLSLDSSADLSLVKKAVPETIALQGNLDPALLFCGGKQMTQKVREICDTLADRAHIFNLGHGVLQYTPPENVKELVETLRSLPQKG